MTDRGGTRIEGAALAIELSQRAGSVALRPRAGADVHEAVVPPATDREDHLMDVIDALCRAHGVGPRQLAMVAVSIGPGGFTGLRVACATAQALAHACGAVPVAVPSAEVVVRTAWEVQAPRDGAGGRFAVVLAVKGEDAWVTRGAMDHGACSVHRAGLESWSAFSADPPDGDVFVDPHAPGRWTDFPGVHRARWAAAACLHAAEAALQRGTARTAIHEMLPLYPRVAEAVSLWEARHGGPRTG
jgi:tRNA threonylcarbamoyl adenosine modification protein YeaZ